MTTRTPRGRRARLLGVLIVPALVVAACGDDDDDASSATSAGPSVATTAGATTTAAPAHDPQGVIRFAMDLTTVNLDPVGANDPVASANVQYLIYDTLLRQNPDGSYEPGLAKSATIVDASTINLTLQDGVKFSDGTALDAAAVKASIERIIASKKTQTFRAEINEATDMTVVSPTQLTIKLKTPISGAFYNLLAHNETLVVSPTAVRNGVNLSTSPVGAGPFKLESFTPSQLVKLVKSDTFFQASNIKNAGFEFVHTTPGPAVVNGMKSGQLDSAYVGFDQIAALAGGNIKADVYKSPDSVLWMSMQCNAAGANGAGSGATNPALRDVRVRQALNYATDKVALNNLLFEGKGDLMQGWWPTDSKFAATQKDVFKRDVAKAKQLLTDAGAANLKLTLMHSPALAQKMAEAVQSQWKEVGIDVTLLSTSNAVADYYQGRKGDVFITAQTRSWTDKITRNFTVGSIGSVCLGESPEFVSKVNTLRATDPASPAAVTLWQDIQKLEIDNALGIIGLIAPNGTAYDTNKLANVSWRPNQVGSLVLDPIKTFVKKR